jgi:hypothetical protein
MDEGSTNWPLHSQNGTVQEAVLSPRQLGMESGADLEQRAKPPVDLRFTRGRLGDSGKDPQ